MSTFLEAFLKSGAARAAQASVLDVKALSGRFCKTMSQYVASQDTEYEDRKYLRASGMGRLCPMQWVLDYWRPHKRTTLGFQGHLYVDVGTMLHSYLQDHLLGPLGVLWGGWQHSSTGEVVRGYHPSVYEPLKDFRSERTHGIWRYVEESLLDEGWRISGHCDGVVSEERLRVVIQMVDEGRAPEDVAREVRKVDGGTRRLLEIKTSNDRLMAGLTGPGDISYDYRMQASLYQKMTGICGTLFWFFNRNDFTQKSLYYEAEAGVLDDAYAKADAVWSSLRNETLPKYGMACTSSVSSRALKCPVKDACWSRASTFSEYVAASKAAQPSRQFLDLSSWTPPFSTAFSKPCEVSASLPGTSL